MRKEVRQALNNDNVPVEVTSTDGKIRREMVITAPNLQTMEVVIIGTSPYVQCKFSEKARQQMHEQQEAGSTAKKGRKRAPKDFKAQYEEAIHKFPGGGCGIPATAFRCAMVSACRLVGFEMTRAKLAIKVEADDWEEDGTPLVKITNGEPAYFECPVRLASGVMDLRARPKWTPGWQAKVRIEFDADIFTATDCMNLLMRAGRQVGVGEGRQDSKKSCGMGWGFFRPATKEDHIA